MPGFAFNLEKDLMEIIAKLPHSFPKHLSIQDQGRFAIGYYQQRETFFGSKSEPAESGSDDYN